MSISNGVIVSKEHYPYGVVDETVELPEEYSGSATRGVILKLASRAWRLDHLELHCDQVATLNATIEFVKLSPTQKLDAYVAAPSASTGTFLGRSSAGARQTFNISDAQVPLKYAFINLENDPEAARTFAPGDRFVAIMRGLTASGTGAGSGADPTPTIGIENGVVAFLGQNKPITVAAANRTPVDISTLGS